MKRHPHSPTNAHYLAYHVGAASDVFTIGLTTAGLSIATSAPAKAAETSPCSPSNLAEESAERLPSSLVFQSDSACSSSLRPDPLSPSHSEERLTTMVE